MVIKVSGAAGSVIHGFASFVVGGDFVIGVVVFAILVIINFMVVTKGAGRIAEVAARFSLDAMPGKQMAIDADLSAGMITDEQARGAGARNSRKKVRSSAPWTARRNSSAATPSRPSSLLWSTRSAASSWARVRHGLDVSHAATLYTTLTIGDGIVSQIPALIVSLGAGMLVSKGSVRGSTHRTFVGQLGGHSKPLFLASGLAALFALLPGLPFLPFAVLSLAGGGGAILVRRVEQRRAVAAAVAARPRNTSADPRMNRSPS